MAADHEATDFSLLSLIPLPKEPSLLPLRSISIILAAHSGPALPVFDLVCSYARGWRCLPEDIKAGLVPSELADHITAQIKNSYQNLLHFLKPGSQHPAIRNPQTGQCISHFRLAEFVQNFRLPIPTSTATVCIVLPNGPTLALACLAVATYYTAVPVASSSGPEQFRADVEQSNSTVVLALRADIARLGLEDSWLAAANIQVLLLDMNDDMTFDISLLDGSMPPASTNHLPNNPEDHAILLFTSGTSGSKKLVPITVHSIVCGVAFVIESWGLKESDCCLQMMPLHHVGGLVRNLFAPIFSGGSTLCCTAFDPNLFWDLVEEQSATWYYASPSMHSAILAEAPQRSDALSKSCIRLVCNAAGGLLPSLAHQIRDTFGCTVLPSYGMTEAMPLSTPPLDYTLDRPGTSGISVGPEISILDNSGGYCDPGVVGRINVRGAPVFPGYLTPDGQIDKSCFRNGWFDTGDLGYLDEEGYLYITGRSKEVINRGGELISPFEVEEAIMTATKTPESPIFNRVSQALAFSAEHDILQEVVGVVLVTPPDVPRVDLRQLHEALKTSLNLVKWPTVIVYMDDLPKRNNKVLRINLCKRLRLEAVTDITPLSERHFEASCPPQDTPIGTEINKITCKIDCEAVNNTFDAFSNGAYDFYTRMSLDDGLPETFVAPTSADSICPDEEMALSLREDLKAILHGYLMPSRIHCVETPLPYNRDGIIDDSELEEFLENSKPFHKEPLSSTETAVRELFAELLSCSAKRISYSSDFFELGGDSLRAGRLLSATRNKFQIRLPIDVLFIHSQVGSLSELIDQRMYERSIAEDAEKKPTPPLPGCTKTFSSTNSFLLAFQLIPIVLVYPMKRAFTWTVFMYAFTFTQNWFTVNSIYGRLVNLILSMGLAGLVTKTVVPLIAIAAKWFIIGRYKEGLFPMWGPYHTRWWIVQKLIAIGGKGVFGYMNFTRVLYYRLLGAKIGRGVQIAQGTTLGEYDLLDIRDNVQLDRCVCRPFAVERNTSMYLGRITLGSNSAIGLSSCIAAGTTLPENTCIGPNSSSWEANDATEANRDLSPSRVPDAHFVLQALVGFPVQVLIKFLRALPWIAGLAGLVKTPPAPSSDRVESVLAWFTSPGRIGFHYLALTLNATLGPIMLFLSVFLIKKIIDAFLGKPDRSLADTRSQLQRFRMSLLAKILPGKAFHEFVELFGTHYEPTSIAVRALGGKVGKRVYWPGTGPSIQDHDLLDIGDDVVFGSRAHLITSDGTSSEHIRVGDGAMIADRVVLLPGTQVGSRTVLGSGAMTRRDKCYPPDTVWVGNKGGEALCLTGPEKSIASSTESEGSLSKEEYKVASTAITQPESISTPFGRAFYEGKAPYRVFGLSTIVFYSFFTTAFTTFYWNVSTTSSIQFVYNVIGSHGMALEQVWWRPFSVYGLLTASITIFMSLQAILALAIVICSKWILLGRRQPGNFDWDKSSYCQRWQLFLAIEKLRRHCYGGHGIIGMLTGTHYAVLYFRLMGATIGRDCALFAGGLPSLLFTEPDLLTLGDRVAVDDASLVSHINSRGNFSLNRLSVGDRSVLRTGSRLLSGANMQSDTCLLEHTLVMAGDVVEAESTYQGWPAESYHGPRISRTE